MGTGDTPKGCTDSSRWLASEASVTTGNVISQLLASRLGCKGFGADTRGCAASRLNPWLISLHPFGVISIIHTFIVSCNSDSLNKSFRMRLSCASGEASNTGKDLIAGFGPNEWLRLSVGGVDELLNRTFQLLDAAVRASTNLFLGQFAKPTFHLVEP